MGYKCVVSREITALHYHKDPISHVKMAYYRGGESYIINKGKLRGLMMIFASFIGTSKNWIQYSFYLKTIDFRLYMFLLSLFIEMMKGGISNIKEN